MQRISKYEVVLTDEEIRASDYFENELAGGLDIAVALASTTKAFPFMKMSAEFSSWLAE